MPALLGKPLQRDAIFTYFPHSPPVPAWLPPAVSVHHDQWKLIRIFHGGTDGAHRYKLFNLAEDPGELHDLSTVNPQRVAELDEMIEAFLVTTHAVRPLPNPAFDPAEYQPELEGIGKLKGGADKATDEPPPAASKAVAGWKPQGSCTIGLQDKAVVVNSTGGDPHISYQLPRAFEHEKFVLQFSMTSDSSGNGQIYWDEQGVTPRFASERSVKFAAIHDGQLHDYAIEFTVGGSLQGLRIDPSQADGSMRLSDIRLTTAQGDVLHRCSP